MLAILRGQSRGTFLSDVARVLVEDGGFCMAVVARHDEARHELVPVGEFGDSSGYLQQIRMFTDERPEGRGAAGMAFRTGKSCAVNDFLNDPRTASWREQARAANWHASAAVPIFADGSTWGILGVYSTEAGFFGVEEIAMLEEVGTDLGFGLDSMAREARRKKADALLARSRRQLKLALDAGGIGIFERDLQTGRIAWQGQTESCSDSERANSAAAVRRS